jgi:protein-disulfide isomerase
MHPWARPAAEAAACARLQNDSCSWSFHDYLFDHQRELTAANLADRLLSHIATLDESFDRARFKVCVDERETAATVERDAAFGRQNNISGTPTLYINGVRVSGYVPAQIRTIIREQAAPRNQIAKFTQQ